jgi:hypothetical protein
MPCGHRTRPGSDPVRLHESGLCPPCLAPTKPVPRWTGGGLPAHRYCECCDTCWVVEGGELRTVVHG